MSTIRVVKNSNYSVINNTVLNDPSLTWEAKGLAVYLLSKPDDWRINTNQLWHASANGHGSVKRILRELERAGYLRRTRTRAPNGVFEWDHALYETPQAGADDSATIGRNPSDGNRRMETVAWIPSDIVSTEYQLLNKEQEQPRAAALPPAPPVAAVAPVVIEEQPPTPATVAAALDGEPLPAAPEIASTPKSLAQQPAVVVYRDTFLAYPSRAQMTQIVQHGVVDLEHWAAVTAAWCKSGYNPRNIGGMLDWYDNPERMIASRPQAKTPGSAGAPRSKVAASMDAVDQVMAMLERQGVTP